MPVILLAESVEILITVDDNRGEYIIISQAHKARW